MSHAILSPSSANRWIHCPPSALLNAEAGDRETAYTREGTLAHRVCELKGRKRFLTGLGPRKYAAEMKKLRADELWQDEMEAHTDAWIDALDGIFAAFATPPHVALEHRVDFSGTVPGGFGTADALMIGRCEGIDGDVLHIADFKYGRGVPVSADHNPQLMLYALGAMEDYLPFYDLFTVRMTVFQPRQGGTPDTFEMPARELLRWAEETAKPAAALAAKGRGEFAEGDWCRWCAAEGSCRARAGAQLGLEADFGERLPPLLTDAEVGEALSKGRRLKAWLKELGKYALAACLDGREIPGWKAVEGRSVRAWRDPEAAFAAARAAGVPEEMLWEKKPVTLAGLEKIMGRRQFLDAMNDYVTTPPGKPALVPGTDRRPPITGRPSADDDFTDGDDDYTDGDDDELPF